MNNRKGKIFISYLRSSKGENLPPVIPGEGFPGKPWVRLKVVYTSSPTELSPLHCLSLLQRGLRPPKMPDAFPAKGGAYYFQHCYGCLEAMWMKGIPPIFICLTSWLMKSYCSKRSSLRNFETRAETDFSVTNLGFDNFHLQNWIAKSLIQFCSWKAFLENEWLFTGSLWGCILRTCNWGRQTGSGLETNCVRTLQGLGVRLPCTREQLRPEGSMLRR